MVDRDKIYQWIIELSNPETREQALLELSKKREVVPDLAPMLWHSFGTMAALLQVIFWQPCFFLYETKEEHLRFTLKLNINMLNCFFATLRIKEQLRCDKMVFNIYLIHICFALLSMYLSRK